MLNGIGRLVPAFTLGLWLVCSGCTTQTSRPISNPTEAIARLRAGGAVKAEVDRLAQPLIASGHTHSLVVGVCLPDGQIQTFGYGRTNHSTSLPNGDSLFEVGSITKAFVAATLALLVEEGRVQYTETVRDILPPDVQVSDSVGRLTLHDLVTHTSGLPRHPGTFRQFHNFMVYFFTGRNPYHYVDRNYLYSFVGDFETRREEPSVYLYSNLGYGLLGHLMEVKTGETLPALIGKKICEPLGLRDTTFAPTPEQLRRLVPSHAGDQPACVARHTPLATWDMGEIMRGSGGLYSTARDLMIFAKSNLGLRRHRLDPLLAATHQPALRTPKEDVAIGWVSNHFPEQQTSISYINGVLSGYSSYLGMDLTNRVAVTVLYANFNWQDTIGHNLVLRLSGANRPAVAP